MSELVDIESPFAGDVEGNLTYARRCMADSLSRGECPIAPHLLYTQPGILDDTIPEERMRSILAGKAWAKHATVTAVYLDKGMTEGMKLGVEIAEKAERKVVYRFLDREDFDKEDIQKLGEEILRLIRANLSDEEALVLTPAMALHSLGTLSLQATRYVKIVNLVHHIGKDTSHLKDCDGGPTG